MEMTTGKKRVYALYRVSTKGQVDLRENDIPMQREFCHKFIDAQPGWTLEREFQELGVSGFKVSAKDRDVVQQIQEAAVRKLFDVLLVFMFDRLGRRDDETPFIVEWFVKQGVEVWSATEGQQRFENHVDKLLNYIRYWQASGESIKTSVRTKTRLEQLTEEGCFTGGSVPYGYRMVKAGRKNKRNQDVFDLEIDLAEAEIVREIFHKYVHEGLGSQRLCKYLSQQGVQNREGKNIPTTSINRILKNVIYTGVIHNGAVKSEPIPELVIVEETLFVRASEIMRERTRKHSDIPRNLKGDALLPGRVFCGHCGNPLTLTTSGSCYQRSDGTVNKVARARYSCFYKTRHPGECDGQSGYGVTKLDKLVEDIIGLQFAKIKASAQADIVAQQQQRAIEFAAARYELARKQCAERQKDLEDLKAETLKVIRGTSNLNADLLNELVGEANAGLNQAELSMQEVQAELDALHKDTDTVNTEYRQLLNWADAFNDCSIAAKKMIVAQFVKGVSVRRGYELEIEFNVSFEAFQRCREQAEAGQSKRAEVKSLQPSA